MKHGKCHQTTSLKPQEHKLYKESETRLNWALVQNAALVIDVKEFELGYVWQPNLI